MSDFFERHEPASSRANVFGWISIKDDKYKLLSEAPDLINRINQYIIEINGFKKFIEYLGKDKQIYSCCYFKNKSEILTKIQKYIKKKALIKEEFVESNIVDELYYKKIYSIKDFDIELFKDSYCDTLLVFSNDKFEENTLVEILKKLDFFCQPKDLGGYFPTENVISSLIAKEMGLVYVVRHYCNWDEVNERDIFVSYSKEKL
ncbi:hypothetical protein [Clostridium intestinale]|uniref:hypothetical protein n=1 Tax=Clostridium intestinale TaxID=36845 RepID=UPI002DD65436|nr:hypothetical protein [Clostridium intestinale]WRY51042.1 hypothetical protein P8F83_20735 [Clostridium intestinale]